MADATAAPSAVQRAPSGPDPLIGRTVNERFKIVALIARGGMGKVYRAEQAPLGRVCALKVLNPNYAGDNDPEFHKRFFLEASIASKLTHPNTVTIFDYGRTEDEIYYMAMEYLEGRTLHRAIREEGPFHEERAAHISRQICRALREAHSLGVIHRDLKPANIYLVEHGDESDFVKVLDFGLVKNVEGEDAEELTQAGLFMGSPKYMSPEQIRGDKVDARTDIYSLGIVLYEMVTGKVPFVRANSVNILMAHVNETPPPLRETYPECSVSPSLEEVIFRCLAKNPDDRFSSMDEMLAALKRAGSGALTGTMMGVAATGEFAAASGSGVYGVTPGAGGTGSGSGANPLFMSPGSGSQSGPLPTLGAAIGEQPAPQGSSSKGLMIGGAVAAVAVVAGIAVLASGSGKPKTTATPSATASATAPPAATSAPAEPKASAAPTASAVTPAKAVLKVTSDPSGAAVRWKTKDGKELCKATPCQITFEGDDAEEGTEHKLYLVKKGFSTENKTIKVGSTKKLSLRLTQPRARPPGGGRKPPGGGNKPGGGWKVVPYLSAMAKTAPASGAY